MVGAGFLVGGFFNSIHNIGIRDLIYTQVPEERQGQAWSMVGAYFGSLVMLGDLLGTPGIYADARTIVTISGTVSVTVAAANLGLYALVRKRLKRLLAVPGEGIHEI